MNHRKSVKKNAQKNGHFWAKWGDGRLSEGWAFARETTVFYQFFNPVEKNRIHFFFKIEQNFFSEVYYSTKKTLHELTIPFQWPNKCFGTFLSPFRPNKKYEIDFILKIALNVFFEEYHRTTRRLYELIGPFQQSIIFFKTVLSGCRAFFDPVKNIIIFFFQIAQNFFSKVYYSTQKTLNELTMPHKLNLLIKNALIQRYHHPVIATATRYPFKPDL